jgi:ATP-dependent exoDNAse (exonuclease V) beta subunit
VTLGPRLDLRGGPDMEMVGRAVHAFLAADRSELDDAARVAFARELLRGHGMDGNLDAAEVAAAGARLWQWIDRTFTPTRRHREWPVAERIPGGTLVIGTADLVVRSAAGLAVIDHKTFPGSLAAALERLPAYSGQLAAYAHAIASATGEPVGSTWIHLPVLGVVVEVRMPA